MTFTHAQYAEKKCTGELRGRNCRFWSHLTVFRTESQYFYSNLYRSRLCIKSFLIYEKQTPSYCVKASHADVLTQGCVGREEITIPEQFLRGRVIVLEYELSGGQIKPEPQKRATCFATFLQNELKSDVALFNTCPATSQVVSGCQRLFQKQTENSSTFRNKICTC